MKTLYKLSAEYNSILDMVDDDGCFTDEALEMLSGNELELKTKVQNIAIMLQSFDNDAAVYDKEIKRLTSAKKVALNNKTRLKNYLAENLKTIQIDEVKTELFKVNFRKSESIIIDEGVVLPDEFNNVKITPDKVLLKKELEKGRTIEGVHLVENKNLQIK